MQPNPRLQVAVARLIKARSHLLLDAPFFGVCALKLILVEDPSCDTAWTDSVHMGYNPDFILSLTDGKIKGLFCHEVLHVAGGHCWRRGSRDPEQWNEACDYGINPIILDAGYELPDHGLLNPAYSGKAAEQIYNMLHTPRSNKPQPKPNPQSTSQEKDSTDKADGSEGASQEDSPEGKPGQGAPKAEDSKDGAQDGARGANKAGKPKAGKDSGKDPGDKSTGTDDGSQKAAGEKPADDASGDSGEASNDSSGKPASQPQKPRRAGEVRDAPAGVDKSKLEEDWKVTLGMAAKVAAMRGTLPGSLQGLVARAKKANVDWRSVLRLFFQQSWTSVDYTWRMPSTRYLSQGLYLPRLASETLPCIVLAEDISGSVPLDMKSAFRAEERMIIEELLPEEAHLLYCDTAVRRADVFRPGDPIEFITVTAGGTDFRPVFEYVEEKGLNPACLVYLTDLEGTFPAEPPPYPVLWVSPPTNLTVPWGDLIEMRD